MRERFALAAALGAALLAAPACAPGINISTEFYPETIEGSGVAGSRTYEVGDFHGLDVGGMYDVEVTVGPTTSLTVDTDENLLELVTVEERDGVLHLGLDKGVDTELGLRATITTPTLDALAVSGICKVRVIDANTERLALDVSGASRVTVAGKVGSATIDSSGTATVGLPIDGGAVEVDGSGASSVDVAGSVKGASIDVSGTCRVTVTAMAGGKLTVDMSGAAKLTVGGAADEVLVEGGGTAGAELAKLQGGRLVCDLGGVASVTLAGEASEARIDLSGTARAKLGDLAVKSLTVELTGASKAVVGETSALAGTASGTSRLEFGGAPETMDLETSGSATFRSR